MAAVCRHGCGEERLLSGPLRPNLDFTVGAFLMSLIQIPLSWRDGIGVLNITSRRPLQGIPVNEGCYEKNSQANLNVVRTCGYQQNIYHLCFGDNTEVVVVVKEITV